MGLRVAGRSAGVVLVVAVAASLLGVATSTPASALVPRLRATAVTAGGFDSCALLEDGSTRCWGIALQSLGYPGHGSVGDDETPGSMPPIDVGPGRHAVDVSAGLSHTCAVLDDGSVRCWGQDESGKLGNGAAPAQEDPATAPNVDLGGVAAVAVEAGYYHSCAVLIDGHLRCWGAGGSGALGFGDTTTIGDDEAVASVPPIDLGPGRTAVSVAVGLRHTCALLDDASVRCWGDGAGGQHGMGSTEDIGDDETPGSVPPVDLGPGRTAVALAAGYLHTCAVLDDGSVRCWGVDDLGLLGDGVAAGGRAVGDDESPASLPPVDLGAGRTAVAIGAGGWHTCAVLDDDSMRCWGQGDEGQLGYGNTATIGDDETPGSAGPVDLGAGRTAVTVDGGQQHTCAVLDDGAVRCWGLNGVGILGLGDGSTANLGDDELPSAVGPIDLGSVTTPELSVSVEVTPAEAYAGDEVAIDVTVRNTGGVALSGVTVDLPEAAGCTGPAGDGGMGLRRSATVHCTRLLTEVDIGALSIAPTATSDQTPTPSAAEPVTVSVLDRPSGLAGTVRDSVSGDPVPGAFVAVLRASDHRVVAGAVADDQGRYRAVVDPSQVFAYAIDPAGNHVAAVAGDPAVRTVVAHELVAHDLTMAPTQGAVAGTVISALQQRPISGALALVLDRGGRVERVVAADAQGRYAATGLPVGEHLVGFVDRWGGHAVRFHFAALSVPAATPITLAAGERETLDATLPLQSPPITAAAVTGAVTEEGTGAPVAGAVVLALRSSDFGFVRATTAGTDGRYRLDLPGGAHLLAIMDPAGRHATEWFDGHPNTALDRADRVTAPAVADAALTPTTGSIRGVVTDAVSAAPVDGAWALAIGPAGIAGAASTGADGAYAVAGLAPGTYRVALVDPTGRRDLEYVDGHADYDDADPIVVTAGGAATADAALH